MNNKGLIKLNLGCGGRPLEGYINVDFDTLDEIKSRYPVDNFPKGITEVFQYDIFNLPYEDNSISEVRTDSMIEHLSLYPEFDSESVKKIKKEIQGSFNG
mgnify:CR=1 FL=1